MLNFTRLSTTVLGKQGDFGTLPLLFVLVQKFKIQAVWTMFVLLSSLVSTVHFSAIYARVMVLKPVQ